MSGRVTGAIYGHQPPPLCPEVDQGERHVDAVAIVAEQFIPHAYSHDAEQWNRAVAQCVRVLGGTVRT